MPYRYSALTASGQLVAGKIDAGDETAAEEALSQAGYRVLTLKASMAMPALEKLMPTYFGVKPGQVINLSRQLAALLEAGIDIVTAVEILNEQPPSGPMRRMLMEITKKLREGSQLGSALGHYPMAFSSTYRKMVEIGEQTGCLEETLRQAATYLEKQREAVKKITRALAYPSMVVGVAVVVVILLVTLVLPAMAGLFANLGAQLPLPTRILMATTFFLRSNFLGLIIGIAAVGIFLLFLLRRPAGRQRLDWLQLKLPLVGTILLYSEVSRFADTMSILLKAGVSVSDSAELGTSCCKNRIVKDVVKSAADELLQGHGLSGPLKRSKLFPPMLVQMVRVGEETGSLDSTLAVVAATYEAEVDERSQAMLSLLEPALTLAIAVVVGFIAMSVIMPIYSVLGSIK